MGEQILPVWRIDAIEAGMRRRRAGDAEMDFFRAGIAHHLHDFLRSRATHDGIVHQHHALAFQLRAIGIVLQAHAQMSDAIRRLDECAPDIMIADDAELER